MMMMMIHVCPIITIIYLEETQNSHSPHIPNTILRPSIHLGKKMREKRETK